MNATSDRKSDPTISHDPIWLFLLGLGLILAMFAIPYGFAAWDAKLVSDARKSNRPALIYNGERVEVPALSACVTEHADAADVTALRGGGIRAVEVIRTNLRFRECDPFGGRGKWDCGWFYEKDVGAVGHNAELMYPVPLTQDGAPLTFIEPRAPFGLRLVLDDDGVRVQLPKDAVTPAASITGTCAEYIQDVLQPAANAVQWRPFPPGQ